MNIQLTRIRVVTDSMRDRITGREWDIGDKLPVNELAREYNLPTLGTLRAALQVLQSEGLVVARQGVGTFVTATDAASTVAQALSRINDAMQVLSEVKQILEKL